ncbi:retrovirus-related pol polyprotein from transposon TNT 1-94 [Tanacetum coccineum]|uniref:Retrovirus-related pol polyprotein from transposon TNT 1-94 n=1 Tax=Tanacetum coccineum TaxID=301880 RepID=A0ABQ5FN80_9ASTR
MKRLLTNKYCPRTEVKKMEDEFYNLAVKGNDLKTYVRRFQELAVLCPNMVPNTDKLMEVFIGGLPKSIEGNVTASKPQTLEEAITITQRLMEQRENRKWLIKALEDGPYVFRNITPTGSIIPRLQEEEDLQGDDLFYYDAEIELMNMILLSIPNEIYNSVDSYKMDKEMWARVERLMRGTIQNQVDRETRFTNEFDQFVAEPGESLVSVYNRFAQLMNDLERNNMKFPTVSVNTKFLNSLQPEWLKYVTQVRLAKRLTVDSFDDLFYYLLQFEKLVNASRAKKLEKSHDPLALVAHTGSSSRNTSSYYVTHPSSEVDYDEEYEQDDVHNHFEDPLASAMLLLSKAITQNFSNPTNNRLRASSNTRNQAVVQGDRVNIQSRNSGNVGRNNRRAYVQGEVVEGMNATNETANVQRIVRTPTPGNTSTGQCYNCGGKGHYARNCPKPRVRDSKYFMEQMLLAKQDEAGVILTDEQNDFLFADASRMEEIKELSANICLMARIQPADQNSDDEPSYESAFVSEVQSSSINENDEQMYPTHTKIINSTIDDDQINSNIQFDSVKGNVNSGSVEKDTHVYDQCALETLARNAYDEAAKQQRFAQKVQQQNMTLTSQIEMYKERNRVLENITKDNNYLKEFLEADERAKRVQKQAESQLYRDRDIIRDLEKQRDQLSQERKKLKKNVDLFLKIGNSLQAMFMLGPKPLSVYDQQLKHGLGYPNPYTLRQAISKCPKLYVASRTDSGTKSMPRNSKRASMFYTSTEEISLNDFCRDQVKPLLNELLDYFDGFHNVFQRDIKEMKDAFEQNDFYLIELTGQNYLSLHDELEQVKKKSLKIQEVTISELKARMKNGENGMNATSSVKRPKSRDSHVKTSVLDVSKNEAKKEHLSPKTRFSEKATQSKTLDTTFVASKSKIDEASASKARDKVSSALKKKKRNMRDKPLSPFMLNKIRTSKLWQKWFESQPNVMWTSVNTKPHAHTNPSNTKPLVSVKRWIVKLPSCPCVVSSCVAGSPDRPMGFMLKDWTQSLQWLGQFVSGDLESGFFGSNTCYVRNLEGDDLLTGGHDLNLYTISISDMAASSPICLMSKATSTKLQVWELVPQPEGKNVIAFKWLWKNKCDAENIVVRNKSRLVAKGYKQEEGIDLEESFCSCCSLRSCSEFHCFLLCSYEYHNLSKMSNGFLLNGPLKDRSLFQPT